MHPWPRADEPHGVVYPLLLDLTPASVRYDGLELDLKIIWNCNADIVVDVQGIEIGIENIRIDGAWPKLFVFLFVLEGLELGWLVGWFVGYILVWVILTIESTVVNGYWLMLSIKIY